ncbi:putative minor extracellular protease vpr [Bisporella sp. PMI_857]|nr:putative minor extracellular protease vpr [Bisporella sp. PMI_857]
MRFSTLLVGLSVVGSSLAVHSRSHVRRDDDTVPTETDIKTAVEAKRFIVEFSEGVDVQKAASELGSKTGTKVLKVFDSDIFKGAAVSAEKENLDSLRALDPVSQAWTSKKIMLAPNEPHAIFSHDATAMNYSIHHMTGVDKLHAAGVRGKGVVVAVVDTGVDYTHPALGGGFGPGFKVAGGYDLVGNEFWPETAEKTPDADPIDQQGHGTHVSGIIAADIFSRSSGTDEETLIDAFLMAYNDGADIITSSIGGLNGWTDNAWAVVASRLVDQGVVVTISAGNDGQAGPYAASSGSSGEHVLAIASVEADVIASASFLGTFNLDEHSNTTYIAYRSTQESSWSSSEVKDWPIFPLGLDTAVLNDACSPLPAGTSNLTNVIVLVRRGGCNFSDKQANVAAFGATHLMVYNNEDPLTIPTPGFDEGLPILSMITAEAGAAIIGTIKAGGNVTADFSMSPVKNLVGVENYPNGGKASYFTTIGPTNELFIKSDIAAPGGLIFSTYIGGWSIQSGTSMACPYVAGVAALYISKHGGRSVNGAGFAKDLAMRIIASGEAIPWDNGNEDGTDYGLYASVAQVGTGLINATKILDYDTTLSFSKFALNDTHHFSRYHNVDITNKGNKPVTYTFEMQDFGGMNTYVTDPDVWASPRIAWLEDVSFSPQKMVPSISFPGGSFTVQPGQTKKASFSFKYPEGLDATKLPVYSGKVLIKGNNGETLGVPYLGLAADLAKNLGIMFQYPIGFPRIISTPAATPFSQKNNFTFDLSVTAQDFPNLYTRLNYATTELRWDIFDSKWSERDWKYPPVVGQAGYVGSATSWAKAPMKSVFDPSVDDANDLTALPLKNLPRDIVGLYGVELWWLGRLANGTQIAPGKYKMRFAALIPFGEPTRSDNWDVFPTPEFDVLKL